LANASRWVVAAIVKLIEARKHTKGQPHTVQVKGDSNTVVVVNAQGCNLEMAPEVYEMFSTRMIDSDLNRRASPLHAGRIERAQLMPADEEGTIEAEVRSEDRRYFEVEESGTITSKETSLDGCSVSLNKESNRGILRLPDGYSVQYQYRGPNPFGFHREFGCRGPVRVMRPGVEGISAAGGSSRQRRPKQPQQLATGLGEAVGREVLGDDGGAAGELEDQLGKEGVVHLALERAGELVLRAAGGQAEVLQVDQGDAVEQRAHDRAQLLVALGEAVNRSEVGGIEDRADRP
jgi:hypothetical protein